VPPPEPALLAELAPPVELTPLEDDVVAGPEAPAPPVDSPPAAPISTRDEQPAQKSTAASPEMCLFVILMVLS
jgi:hypothetical protein